MAFAAKGLLRCIACGSVDDVAILLDGLQAEREQGVANEVTYRHFETATRKYTVAQTLGHGPDTRNLVAAASSADLALLVLDASQGLRVHARRSTLFASLLGIRHVVLAVNKMDRVDHSQAVFERIAGEYLGLASSLGIARVDAVPVIDANGDNLIRASAAMPWYRGATLLGLLEAAPIEAQFDRAKPLRLPVQRVDRLDAGFRGIAGTLASGSVRPGERVRIMSSGRVSAVQRVVGSGADLPEAVAHQAVTLTLSDDIDVSRGDMLVDADNPPEVADRFEASLVWLHEQPLLPGRAYAMQLAARNVTATVAPLKYRINVDTLAHEPATTLAIDEVGVVALELDRKVAFDAHSENRETGGFSLIDRLTHDTVAAGMLHFALRRSHNVHWQVHEVSREARAVQKGQKACVVWFTGLSGAGKSTLADLVERRLFALGHHTYLLDGDNLRHGLNKDLGFTDADRVENIRRVTEVAAMMADAGLIVLTAFISPFRSERDRARSVLCDTGFLEVHVDAPLALVEQRDPKGLYRKARRGELRNFTGIDSPYEEPEDPELRLDTGATTADACADAVLALLRERGFLRGGV